MNKTVLVVDDDADILDALQMMLELDGYRVKKANNDSFVGSLHKNKPDLILLDILLSGSDGRDICREIKKNPKTNGIPIIMVSAHPSAGNNAINCGADDFISKPFEIDELLNKVKRYIK